MPFAVNRDPEGFFMLRSHLKKARSVRAAKYFIRALDLAAPSHLSVGSCFPRAELESRGFDERNRLLREESPTSTPRCSAETFASALCDDMLRTVCTSHMEMMKLWCKKVPEGADFMRKRTFAFSARKLLLLPRSGRSCWVWTWEGTFLLQTSC